jgi:hypothetical protein
MAFHAIIPALLSLLAAFSDFTFSVPVSLQDYHQPSSVVGSSQSIYCGVYTPAGAQIGVGRTPIAIPASGNFNATVTVEVTVASGHRASEATDYKCWFAVADNMPASTKLTDGELKARPGTTPVLLVSGRIPR